MFLSRQISTKVISTGGVPYLAVKASCIAYNANGRCFLPGGRTSVRWPWWNLSNKVPLGGGARAKHVYLLTKSKRPFGKEVPYCLSCLGVPFVLLPASNLNYFMVPNTASFLLHSLEGSFALCRDTCPMKVYNCFSQVFKQLWAHSWPKSPWWKGTAVWPTELEPAQDMCSDCKQKWIFLNLYESNIYFWNINKIKRVTVFF